MEEVGAGEEEEEAVEAGEEDVEEDEAPVVTLMRDAPGQNRLIINTTIENYEVDQNQLIKQYIKVPPEEENGQGQI